ncbi:MAG: ATP-dependent metallopeptidase FtsH/Yme1/Tma family protein [Bdellovibrionaceae bacterium]|nr:ATP-dependent zinc metalloprotease FtsH [Bdellovibrionales bacterium]MCB9085050.1 ATP-dependent metallopeptidase FtsH/Yme1/Tma family protein [Pseudobdellovibrionaceae bacterium]
MEDQDSKKKIPQPLQAGPWWRNPFNVFLVVWLGFLLIQYLFLSQGGKQVSYSEFLDLVENGKVKEVTLSEEKIFASLQEEGVDKQQAVVTYPVNDKDLTRLLRDKGVKFQGTMKSKWLETVVAWLFPILLLVFFFRMMMNRMGGATGGLMNFGKSKARVFMEKGIKTSFADVAGVDEAKEELEEIVSFLKEPDKYSRLGGRSPKGILLVGPPGTGKTLLARAVAGEASVPFFSINGSEFVELFVGMGAARVRDLFEQARKTSPCIIFIDELDALGRSRSAGYPGTGANDEKEQTLNQLLAELDGFDPRSGIVILAATNRPEILDPALLRAGRFDRQVLIDNPDQHGREQILNIHVKKIILSTDVDLRAIASLTPGFSGADLANLVNEAALVATRRGAESVTTNDFTSAIERIVAGLERRKRIMNPDEKRRVAFHEMGHATVALALQCRDRVHKISIIPRGIGALGYTLQRPTEDRYLMTREELMRKIAVLLGGRTSERLMCEDVSTGASDDLAKASDIARAMVSQYGMSEKLGLGSFERADSTFLRGPNPFPMPREFSEKTGELIDQEIKAFLSLAESLAETSIRLNDTFINKGVEVLLQEETLDADRIVELWGEYGRNVSGSAATSLTEQTQ